ncbi:hypothetical protein [Nocardia sp. NPDC020380]|uniref:hypothetical protein n=1 Tax=Nocardia sp. NPDC020380 TaxID=3364309 RepID=UPI00378CEECD
MYLAKPHTTATTAPPLGLARIEVRHFGRGEPYSAEFLDYFQDLSGQFGQPYHPDYFAQAAPNSFTAMASEILSAATPPDETYDLAVIAHTTPDAKPTRPACYLAQALSGDTLSFALSEQGVTAPFTALQLTREYARDSSFRRGLVMILDQSFLWNGASAQPPRGTRMPGRDAAVVLILEPAGALGPVTTLNLADVGPAEARELVDAHLHEAAATGIPTTTIAGAGVDTRAGDGEQLYWAAADLPCAGLWTAFAERLPQWQRTGQRVELIDYDPVLRYLSLCTIEVPGGSTES